MSSGKLVSTEESTKAKRDRSPNFPVLGLPTALELAEKIYEKEKRAEVVPDIAAKHLGYSTLSGRARRVLSALKAYGLFNEQPNGHLKISEQGVIAMVFKEGTPERDAALREMALRPPIFQKLLQRFGADLPSDEGLRARLITEYNFLEDGANTLIRAFRESLPFAKFGNEGLAEDTVSLQSASPTIGSDQSHTPVSTPIAAPTAPQVDRTPSYWKTVFPVGKGLTVEIHASAPLKAKHYDLLIKHVNLLKEAAEAEENEESLD
jgi:hypothetical protein